MLISLQWLNQYLDRSIDADQADALLTAAGFPLDGREPAADDIVLDVEVTSNRPDCLSHVGVAREVAAASGRTLQRPTIDIDPAGPDVNELTSVDNQAADLCPLYTARVIRGVKIGPSPRWLARELEAIGLRPVNNVVDITNFVLHELGQPLHAFDMHKLAGRRIVVRRATAGEPFTAIDGTKHKLAETMLVIADQSGPVAVAGVMGGRDSEVGDPTTDILIESARFDPLSVRTTSRTLKLASDSSYRFERGVDPAGVDRASRRAAQLIVELAGGELASGVIAQGESPAEPRVVAMRVDRCRDLLGHDVPVEGMIEKLAGLELAPTHDGGDTIRCTIPPHRLDLHREADLIEEVARTAGYDAIPVKPKMALTVRPPQPLVLARRAVDRVLVAHGFHETITFSNIAPDAASAFVASGDELIALADARAAAPALRPSVLPSLLAVRKTNQDAHNTQVKLYEIARAFTQRGGAYHEQRQLALLADAQDEASLRGLRGTIEELLDTLGVDATVQPTDDAPRWAAAAGLIVAADQPDKVLGAIGRVNATTLKQFDLKVTVDAAWLDYQAITAGYPPTRAVGELRRFPAIERDLSVVVDEAVAWAAIESAVRRPDPPLLQGVDFLGVYRGKQVGAGRKSVSFRMRFSDPDKTLRHEEVDPQVQAVVASLKQRTHAELRTV